MNITFAVLVITLFLVPQCNCDGPFMPGTLTLPPGPTSPSVFTYIPSLPTKSASLSTSISSSSEASPSPLPTTYHSPSPLVYSPSLSPYYELSCAQISTGRSTCLVTLPITVTSQILTFNYSTLITPALNLERQSNVILNSNQQVLADDEIVLGGRLTIVLSSDDSILVRDYKEELALELFICNASLSGEFDTIEVQNSEAVSSCGVDVSGDYGEISMMALIRRRNCAVTGVTGGGNGALGAGAIAGIVVGTLVGAVLLFVLIAGIGAIAAMIVKKNRRDAILALSEEGL